MASVMSTKTSAAPRVTSVFGSCWKEYTVVRCDKLDSVGQRSLPPEAPSSLPSAGESDWKSAGSVPIQSEGQATSCARAAAAYVVTDKRFKAQDGLLPLICLCHRGQLEEHVQHLPKLGFMQL